MNENNQRKTLISIKVSTLLLIVLAIIVVAVTLTAVLKNNNKPETSRETVKTVSSTEKNSVSNVQAVESQKRNTNLIVSSRSLDSREQLPIIEEIEEPEIVEEIPEEPVIVTTPIEEVTISKDMDLTVRTGLSRDDFIVLISDVKEDTSNFFEENAGLIYDLCEKYQLNEIFFCGLISAESGWNIAQNHRNTHNYISLMSGNGLIRFASVEDGLEKAAQTLHDKYLTPGGCFYYGPTLAAMKTRFCPASSTWVNLVFQRMQQILK